jgi:hypothetical protein
MGTEIARIATHSKNIRSGIIMMGEVIPCSDLLEKSSELQRKAPTI